MSVNRIAAQRGHQPPLSRRRSGRLHAVLDGAVLTLPACLAVVRLPFVTQNRHVHQVGVLALNPERLSRPTFFHKPAGQVTPDRPLILRICRQGNPPCAQVAEPIIQ